MIDKSVALAVFVKTPSISPVKTRLAKSIGENNANQVFHFLLDITRSILQDLVSRELGVEIYWALAEKDSLDNDMWSDYPTLWQGEGELGEKLFNIQSQLFKRHQHIIFIGADAPFLTSSIISEAIFRLRNYTYPQSKAHTLSQQPSDVIIGPSLDGGFYLYAASIQRSLEQWTKVIYSNSNTTNELLASFGITKTTHFLRELYDIDTLEDLKLAYNQLLVSNQQQLTSLHFKFLDWIQQNLSMFSPNYTNIMGQRYS